MLDRFTALIGSIPDPIVLIIGVVMLLAGGHWLVESAIQLARRMGVSTLVIGLTIVAFGTSSPELAFNLIAASNGNGELSFGNVVGSNIANIALVLGIAACISPLVVNSRVIRVEIPQVLAVSVGMVVLAWIPWSPLMGDRISGPAVSRIDGILMLVAFGIFTWLWIRMARSERKDPMIAEVESDVEAAAKRPMALRAACGLFIVSLAILVGGGKLTEIGAVGIAEMLGMSQAMIGLTVVAIATSLPEVITSAIAARKGHGDLAVGNVVGSNLFNILLVLGATTIVAPVPVPAGRGIWDLAIMLGLTALLWPLAVTHSRRLVRIEGAFLLACYAGYLAFSVFWEIRFAASAG